MKNGSGKVLLWDEALYKLEALRRENRDVKVIFTNGCFDLIHMGHVCYLREAASLGDFLVVGVNSDRSVREIKGPLRPITPENERAEVLAALEMVDAVVIFDDPTPLELIALLGPDVLVKGGDWPVEKIVGREVVWARGGNVLSIPLTEGVSTTGIVERIIKAFS